MKIEKLNDTQIRCTLTREDLAARGIRFAEFAYGSDKAKELFREVMQWAAYKFGFDAADTPLMIEAVPMSQNSITLIVTKVDNPEELDARFSHYSEDPDELEEEDSPAQSTRPEPLPAITRTEDGSTCLYEFDRMDDLIALASRLPKDRLGRSSLYQDPQKHFYLLVSAGDLEKKAFAALLTRIAEYGTTRRVPEYSEAYYNEHYDAIILGDALDRLSEL